MYIDFYYGLVDSYFRHFFDILNRLNKKKIKNTIKYVNKNNIYI